MSDGTEVKTKQQQALVNADLPNPIAMKVSSTLTLASDAVTVTKNYHLIAAQSGTADDLVTLNGGTAYQMLVIQADAGDTITVKHGTGNIYLNGAADFSLSGDKTLVLFYDGTNWSDAGAGGGGASDHALLDNLNSANYTHLTAANHTDLTDGGTTTLHSHPGGGGGSGPSVVTLNIDGALAIDENVGAYVVTGSGEISYCYIYCTDPGTARSTIIDVNIINSGISSTIFTTSGNRPTLDYDDIDKMAKSGIPDIVTIVEGNIITFDIDDVAIGAEDLSIGLVVNWSSVGNLISNDTIWDAKGDLAVGTGVNTAAKLTVGANGKVLMAASGEATGLKWDTPAGGGDFVGPAGATNGNLVVFDGVTGKLGKDGGAIPASGATSHEQGNMVNGKIVVSVASNNLTVALKNLAGNDPSAGDPVLVRIGDVIRTLTAALSVTKNSGTNWCNAGSAELATKEIDYFVYLGYNATDGVVIGFSRIPGGTEYDSFSTTTTNEKFCAISTITTAAAGDDYVNIGRFAATLSAGAGYTWTVPTFTNKNLIQRPMFESRWLDWQPVYSASGSMTYTGVTTTRAKYKIRYDDVAINLYTSGTTGGTASNAIYATPPFTPALAVNWATKLYYNGLGNWQIGIGSFETTPMIVVTRSDSTQNFATTTDARMAVNNLFAI